MVQRRVNARQRLEENRSEESIARAVNTIMSATFVKGCLLELHFAFFSCLIAIMGLIIPFEFFTPQWCESFLTSVS